MSRWPVVLAATLVGVTSVSAAELRGVEMQHDAGEYRLVSEAWFDARLDATYFVFSRWDHSSKFSSAIVEARDLAPGADGRPGFYVKNRGCVLFFCKTLVRQGSLELEPNSVLRAFADPQYSDFEFSNETWTFAEEDGGTRVRYELHMDPKFWVPPAIGPYLIKRKFTKDGLRALERIEDMAQQYARGESLD
ncbi:MAG: hypothetical protein KJP17_00595 [Gammaproteobacteria bacterium]|nr:hypothetical protein [Gammaproteobacteria bacterium]